MDFELNADQRSLREVVRDLLTKRADSAATRAVIESDEGWDAGLWHTLAQELGLVGLTVPDVLGGSGGGLVDLVLVQDALGEHLATVPYLATVVAAELIRAFATPQQQAAWLPELCSGTVTTVAVAEGDEPWVTEMTSVVATDDDRLTGRKDHVFAAECAAHLLVPARTADGAVRIYRLSLDAPGVTVTFDKALDPTRRTATVNLADTHAERVGDGTEVLSTALERVHLVASLALAAEQVGGMRRCLDLAVAHASSRVQFDRPIGAFQAVKHRLADMYVALSTSEASLRFAAWSLDAEEQGAVAVRLAQSRVADAYYRVARDAIQVHGGIGCTWEHDMHLYLKRAMATRVLLGDGRATRERAALLLGI